MVTVAYLALLAALAGLHIGGILHINDAKLSYAADVAWFASLGAAMASLHAIYRDVTKWNPAANLAYLVRPLAGAVFGSVAYFTYVVVAQATLIVNDATGRRSPSLLALMIAFALGYREDIFRLLLQRVIDLLATAGGADTEPPSPPGNLRCLVRDDHVVELRWTAATDNVAVTGYHIYRDYRFLTALSTLKDQSDDVKSAEPAAVSSVSEDRPDQASITAEGQERTDRRPAAGEPAAEQQPHRYRFEDQLAEPGRIHQYSVTAVDGAANESQPVGPYAVHIPPARSEPTTASDAGRPDS